MKHPPPNTPTEWLQEIRLAIADAREAKALGPFATDANLFHLAPLDCRKFRGRKLDGPEAKRVAKVALANALWRTQTLKGWIMDWSSGP